MAGKKLTPRQQRFVDEYLIDLNATAAAGRAGYRDPNKGRQLVTNSNILPFIQAAMSARSNRTQIKADNVLRELAKVAFSDMRDFAVWGPGGVQLKDSSELSNDAAACVAEVTTSKNGSIKFRLHGKVEALGLIGKHLKLFTKVHEHTGIVLIEDEHWYNNDAHRATAAQGSTPPAPGSTPSRKI